MPNDAKSYGDTQFPGVAPEKLRDTESTFARFGYVAPAE